MQKSKSRDLGTLFSAESYHGIKWFPLLLFLLFTLFIIKYYLQICILKPKINIIKDKDKRNLIAGMELFWCQFPICSSIEAIILPSLPNSLRPPPMQRFNWCIFRRFVNSNTFSFNFNRLIIYFLSKITV